MNLETNVKNREYLIAKLKEEMIGPVTDFSFAKELTFDLNDSEKNGKFYYHIYGNKKEEIMYGTPQKKYNSGLIIPLRKHLEYMGEEDEDANILSLDIENASSTLKRSEKSNIIESSSEELITSNQYMPSTFGMTFAVSEKEENLKVIFRCGVYKQRVVNKKVQHVDNESRNPWWFRYSLFSEVIVDLDEGSKKQELTLKNAQGIEVSRIKARFDSTVRNVSLSSEQKSIKIVTINVTNITDDRDSNEAENILFQCELTANSLKYNFQPYPTAANLDAKISNEDKKFDLLYSKELNYAFGQNCSTIWDESENVKEIRTTFLPEYEIKTMTPDVKVNGKKIEITHAELASAKNYQEMQEILYPLIEGYEEWLNNLKKENVLPYYKEVYTQNINDIEKTIERMRNGLEKLIDPIVFNAFRLTNLSLLMQMVTGHSIRHIISDNGEIKFDKENNNPFESLNYTSLNNLADSISEEITFSDAKSFWKLIKWRGFQIAFLIMNLDSFVEKDSDDRENVDLIWFPTGGGKTEAYLSCAAFSIIYRRMIDPNDTGTDIIMRYTLRLLTADQFQRSARLICSLDFLRKKFPDLLGETCISLGMWVGSANTPNDIQSAKSTYTAIINKSKPLFPVTSCPWCGAEMKVSSVNTYHGYKWSKKGLILCCPDRECSFHSKLPINFIDEQMYKEPPTFLIGTIDKFVQLTWKSEARAFFGIDNKGNRIVSPPNLIIQDELHLISGPLGTLSGIYEVLVEELCTDDRDDKQILPKIICATATIKAYESQITSLYARNSSTLFPPSGIDINDNFFSTVLKEEDGKNARGRKYVGVYPFTQGRLQTEVQSIASLLTATCELPENERDPYWTILSFYNSISDIGKGLILSEQDIPNNMKNYYDIRNVSVNKRRHLRSVKELTSRLDSDKVGFAIAEMKVPYTKKGNKALDLILASNIIEVGVDINRLSLMTINGQPKTSAQYIQVSGRVGRKVDERPGLVVVEYNPANSNDKSHYEHFVEFHQKLYAQVEESSVTPFSKFAIKRGLPAVIIGYLRQAFDNKMLGSSPDNDYIETPLVKAKIAKFLNKIKNRAEKVDDTEIDLLIHEAVKLLNTLSNNSYDAWQYRSGKKTNNGFMVPLTKDQDDIPDNVYRVMFSMRSVDAIVKLEVMSLESKIGESDIDSNLNQGNDNLGGWF